MTNLAKRSRMVLSCIAPLLDGDFSLIKGDGAIFGQKTTIDRELISPHGKNWRYASVPWLQEPRDGWQGKDLVIGLNRGRGVWVGMVETSGVAT